MEKLKIDPSLAEVREWREKTQKEYEGCSSEEFAEKLSQKGRAFLRKHNITLRVAPLPDHAVLEKKSD